MGPKRGRGIKEELNRGRVQDKKTGEIVEPGKEWRRDETPTVYIIMWDGGGGKQEKGEGDIFGRENGSGRENR